MQMDRVLKNTVVGILLCFVTGILFLPVALKATVFEPSFTENNAVSTLNNILEVEIPANKADLVWKDYSLNLIDEVILIVCDLHDVSLEDLVYRLRLKKTILPIVVEPGYYSEEFNNVLNRFYDSDELFCRYGCDMLIDGTAHIASIFIVSLSKEGRLLLYIEE